MEYKSSAIKFYFCQSIFNKSHLPLLENEWIGKQVLLGYFVGING